MINEWKDVPGYGGKYSASVNGSVIRKPYISKRGDRLKGKSLVQAYDNRGYLKVCINRRSKLAHRIIAMTFLPNPENKPEVNHINGVKNDNRVCNLEWVTNQENIDHACKMGLRDTQAMKISYKKRRKALLDTSTGKVYFGITEMAKTLMISQSYLSMMLNGSKPNHTTFIHV